MSLLSIESWSRSEENSGGQQMSEARTFEQSVFNENYIHVYVKISTESLMTPDSHRVIKVCSSELGNRPTHRNTHTQNDYCNPRTCAEG